MSLEFIFTCSLPGGLHVRPAAQLADLANVFAAGCSLTNLRNGVQANLKSPLAIIAAHVRSGDSCSVRVEGSDEAAAVASLRGFVEVELPKSDEPSTRPPLDDHQAVVPRDLCQAGVECYFGHAVHRGIGQGKIVFVDGMAALRHSGFETPGDRVREEQRMRHALANVQAGIRALLALPGSAAQKAVIKAQLSIAADISLADKIAEGISEGRSAGQAILQAGEFFLNVFHQSESPYIRERALDLQDVLQQLLLEIYGAEFPRGAVELCEPSVAVADVLSPQQLLSLDRRWLRAIVLQDASTTAHAVILARSLGIPTLVGVKDALRRISPGQRVVVDANRGLVVSESHAAVRRFYAREIDLVQRRNQVLAGRAARSSEAFGTRQMEVAANVGSHDELAVAFEQGADGIGLLRTEMLFLEKQAPATEDEQFATYLEATRLAGDRPVIIRTLDIGADKPLANLSLPKEPNPFLGYRGVRIYPGFRDLLRLQLRAILRASAFGHVWIMTPMVSTLQEVLWVKALIDEVKSELKAENITFNSAMPLGIMLEVPSIAFMLDALAVELDFFSLGTNDLSQYFFAADRGNGKVATLAAVRHPAFLRFLRQIVSEIRERGKWIGMCGEMAADPANLPLLVALGLNEISVPAAEIPELKERLHRLSAPSCQELFAKAIACRDVHEVDDLLLNSRLLDASQPLLVPELVVMDDSLESKEAAVEKMVEALFLSGRTEDPQSLEQAIWDREGISSTGLGYGFAIPHCKTDAVLMDSIGILKTRRPIPWGSRDENPVRMLLLLAVRESQANERHLQILSRLARKLMDEDFRMQLLSLEDADTIVSYLAGELDLALVN